MSPRAIFPGSAWPKASMTDFFMTSLVLMGYILSGANESLQYSKP